MKKFAKIFLAVAALFAGVACTTDVTEDLGVNPVGQTTLTLSLEESRTQLGEKADGVYPLFWSEGDKIAVNGVASNEVSTEQAGKSTATFTMSDAVSRPYNIIYPAPAEGTAAVIEDCYPVVFPATQTYNEANVDGSAMAMYGYAGEGETPTLNHLSGVLRFAVKGEVVLSQLTVSTVGGAIAGTFDVDCTSGTMTAQTGVTSESVSMSFGDGLQLKANEATPIFVVVPAGDYGVVSVTLLTSTGEKMAVMFDSNGDKAVNAGTVREFGEFSFVANVNEDGEFLIDSTESLIKFSKIASNFAPYTIARVVAPIDMTDVEYSMAEGFAHTFDGGNFEIKGLSAPLFGNTTAKAIKNVKLVDVDITTERAEAGALVCSVLDTETEIENCSVTGKFTVEGKSVAALHSELQYGAMIGLSQSTKCYKNLYTNVAMVVNGSFVNTVQIANLIGYCAGSLEDATCHGTITFNGTTSGSKKRLRVGGVANSVYLGMKNCVNGSPEDDTHTLGSITIGGTRGQDTEVGGIAVYPRVTMEDCHNYGNINIGGNAASTYFGGICRYAYNVEISNCTNHGNITVDSKGTGICYSGGLVSEDGSAINSTITNCTNYGNIKFTENATLSNLCFGGLVGRKEEDVYMIFDNCTNEGDIEFCSTITGYAQIGGLVGCLQNNGSSVVSLLTFKNNNTNTGNITSMGTVGSNIFIGGVAGQCNGQCFTTDSFGVLTNKGNIHSTTDAGTGQSRVSGFIAATNGTKDFQNVNMQYINECDVTVINDTPDKSLVAGFMAYRVCHISNVRSFCNVSTNATYAGMFVANTDGYLSKYYHYNCYVGGSFERGGVKTTVTRNNYTTLLYHTGITDGSDAEKEAVMTFSNGYISSIDAQPQYKEVGLLEVATADDLFAFVAKVDAATEASTTCTDYVKVTANIDMTGKEWTSIEGFAGIFDGGNFEIKGLNAPLFGTTQLIALQNVKLTDVTLSVTPSGSSEFRYGSLARYINNKNATIENCSASGAITINMTSAQTNHIRSGGLIGRATTTRPVKNLENNVNVTVTGNGTFAGKDVFLAGVIAETAGGLAYCKNFGTISAATTLSSAYLSGIVTRTLGNIIHCENGLAGESNKEVGKIVSNCDAAYTIIVGGIYGTHSGNAPAVVSDCVNYANIEVGGTHANNRKYAMIGGVAGTYQAFTREFSRCKNYGDITVSTVSGTSTTNNFFIGGVSTCESASTLVVEDLENHGNILVTEKAVFPKDLLIGGITNVIDSANITYGSLINTGDITINGTVGGALHCGGVAGRITGGTFTEPFQNTGNVSVYGTVTGSHYIGGIAGNLTTAISGATSYCDILTMGLTNIGLIVGAPRSDSAVASDCKLGGRLATELKDTEDADGNATSVPVWVDLTAENFFNYIYGGTTDWTGVENYDGCSVLTTAPEI